MQVGLQGACWEMSLMETWVWSLDGLSSGYFQKVEVGGKLPHNFRQAVAVLLIVIVVLNRSVQGQ